MKSTILTLLLASASLAACAQSATPDHAPAPATTHATTGAAAGTPAAVAEAALHKINPDVRVEQIEDAPLPGFQQAIVAGQVLYVSNDGKYLMQGSLYDVDARQDLGERAMAKVRKELLKKIPASDRIVFAPANPKYTLTVFTDIDCPYCRKMHSEIADYNRQGIAIEYVAFPRMGLGSEDFKKMVAVWCAADPKKALTDAKNDRPVPYRNCKNPVTAQYALGQRMGLAGTPMILTPDGVQLGGYVPPDKLRATLDQLATSAAARQPGKDAAGSR